jgi:periplasmic protein TorT
MPRAIQQQGKTIMKKAWIAVTLAIVALCSAPAARAADWWPVKVYDMDSGKPVETDYAPLPKASKAWNVCVLFPHMKDTFWVAVDYGIVEEAKRMGVNMTLYQAGGYENLPQQLAQFDDCMAGNFDAIVVGPISEAGLTRAIRKATEAGKPVISTVNPLPTAPATARMFVDFTAMGEQTGKFLADDLHGKPANVVNFPGPAGSGWAEQFNQGFKNAIKSDSSIKLLGEKFGDSGVAVQLGLIQNALQSYPDMNVIWGCAPAAEAAIGAVRQANRDSTLIISSYENQAMLDALNKGEILAFATQYPVLEGRVAIDTAVRILEHKPYMKYSLTIPSMVDKQDLSKIDMSLVLAPASFKAEYSVSAK